MKILITACSWCRRIEFGGRWIEMPETLKAAERAKQVSHGVCNPCASKIRKEFKTMREDPPHECQP